MTEAEFFAQLADVVKQAAEDVVKQAAEDGIDAAMVLAMFVACQQGQQILDREGIAIHEDQSPIVLEWGAGLIDEVTMIQRCREVVSGG